MLDLLWFHLNFDWLYSQHVLVGCWRLQRVRSISQVVRRVWHLPFFELGRSGVDLWSDCGELFNNLAFLWLLGIYLLFNRVDDGLIWHRIRLRLLYDLLLRLRLLTGI